MMSGTAIHDLDVMGRIMAGLPLTSQPPEGCMRLGLRRWRMLSAAFAGTLVLGHAPAQPLPAPIAIVGATLIDGNGGPPVSDAVVVISGSRITAAGARGSVSIPSGATQIEGRGRWLVPGLIDTNVHLSLYGGQND